MVALPILLLFLVIKYHKEIRTWILSVTKPRSAPENEGAKCPSDVKRLAPYPAQPIKGRECYRVMMDIRKLDAQNWLTLDKNYMAEHRVRDHLLREKRDQVLRCLPESAEACWEALEEVSSFLCQRFSNTFQKITHDGDTYIENRMTGEKFNLTRQPPNGTTTDALEAAVRLTMEDLSILMQNEEGEYYLYGRPRHLCLSFTYSLIVRLVRVCSRRAGQSISALDGQFPNCTDQSLSGTNMWPTPSASKYTIIRS